MEVIATTNAPKALGPYSQAVLAGSILFVSGQIAINPETGEMVVKTTIFVDDIKNFDAINAVYAKTFKIEPPARSFVQVAALPKGAHVEIEVIARR